jgi:hypothetical protein
MGFCGPTGGLCIVGLSRVAIDLPPRGRKLTTHERGGSPDTMRPAITLTWRSQQQQRQHGERKVP